MGLQLWLPLNGNIFNHGIGGDITLTGNTMTVANGGKLGQCYAASSSKYVTLGNYAKYLQPSHTNSVTLTCWIKSSACDYIIACSAFEFRCSSANVQFRLGNGSTNTYAATSSVKPAANTWSHVAGVWDAENKRVQVYLNGNKVGETTVPANAAFNTINATTKLPWDGTDVYLNDFRAYDEALSPREIKEISKGLVMHYPFNVNTNIMTNAYVYPTFNTSGADGGWQHWPRKGASGTQGQNTNKEYIFNKANAYSHWVSNAVSATAEYLLYQSPAFEGGWRSLCAIIKHESYLPINDSIIFPAWNAPATGSTPNGHWTSINYLGDGFYLCKCEGIKQDGSNDLVGMYLAPGHKVFVSEAYLENDRKTCSFPSSDARVADCSGNGYHMTSSSAAIPEYVEDADSPRYRGCYHFASNAKYLQTPAVNMSGFANSYTISWWANLTDYGSKMMWGFKDGNRLNYFSGLYCNTGDGDSNPFYSSGTTTITRPSTNVWHHFAMVGDGTSVKLYKDGSLYGTAKAFKPISGTTIIFSGWDTGTSYRFTGYLSDFRLYSTALTATEVKEIYNSPFHILKTGGLMIQGELVEK